jgi:hypothetical protein
VLLALLAPIVLLAFGCRETQELFPELDAASPPPVAAGSDGTAFQLISIGANAQVDGTDMVNGFGAAIILRDEQLLFWGNGGDQTDGRGIVVAAIDPLTRAPTGPVESFDTWETRFTGGTETARLNARLEAIEPGMLVLLVVGDDAGVTDNGTPEVLCNLLEDDDTQRLFELLAELGSRQIREYCYRASWAMAAYKGKGTAEQEVLLDGAPAHVTVRVP